MSTVSSEHGRRGQRRALSAGHTAASLQATPQLSPRSPGPDKLLAVFHQWAREGHSLQGPYSSPL